MTLKSLEHKMSFGLPELVIILIIVLLLFGGKRLPELSRSIGQSIKDVRDGFASTDPPTKNKQPEDKKSEK